MALMAAVGQAQALDGAEAGIHATQLALNQIGRAPVVMGLVFAWHDFSTQQVLHGVSSLLGETPLLGFSTPATLTRAGQHPRSVAVALIAGSEVNARADWWPGFADESMLGSDAHATSQKMLQALEPQGQSGTLLLAGDGLGSAAERVVQQIFKLLQKNQPADAPLELNVGGGLASGDLRRGRTYQIGGGQSGSGGLAAAYLSGRVAVGVGVNHGWTAAGTYFKVTRANGLWLRMLDDRPVSETYAHLFGHRPREWGLPPLNELVRLYPLGFEEEQEEANGQTLRRHVVRAPLRMENDGSLRLNAPVRQGQTGYLLVGSVTNCLEAARLAAREAVTNLKKAPGSPKPALALVLVDVAWKMLLQAQPGEEMAAVCSVVGPDVPVIGGYTFGQIARTGPHQEPELLNQQIEVVVFGEPREA